MTNYVYPITTIWQRHSGIIDNIYLKKRKQKDGCSHFDMIQLAGEVLFVMKTQAERFHRHHFGILKLDMMS